MYTNWNGDPLPIESVKVKISCNGDEYTVKKKVDVSYKEFNKTIEELSAIKVIAVRC